MVNRSNQQGETNMVNYPPSIPGNQEDELPVQDTNTSIILGSKRRPRKLLKPLHKVVVNGDKLPSEEPNIPLPVPISIMVNLNSQHGENNMVEYPAPVMGNGVDKVQDTNMSSILSQVMHPNVSSIQTDHSYIHESPQTIKRKLDRASAQLCNMKKRLKNTQQKYRRLSRKYEALMIFVQSLQGKMQPGMESLQISDNEEDDKTFNDVHWYPSVI